MRVLARGVVKPPQPRHTALGRIVIAGLAERRQELDEIEPLLRQQRIHESARHQRSAIHALGDVRLHHGHFLIGGVAEDDFAVRFLHHDAAEFLIVLGRDVRGVKPFLDLGVRVKQRLDEIIRLRARADAGHVRADLSAHTADGVTDHAREFRPAINPFTASGVAFRNRFLRERENFCGRKLLVREREAGEMHQRLCQCGIPIAFTNNSRAYAGRFRRERQGRQFLCELLARVFDGEQFTPEFCRVSFIGCGFESGADLQQRGREVEAGQGDDGRAAHFGRLRFADELLQLLDRVVAADGPQRGQGGSAFVGRGLRAACDLNQLRPERSELPDAGQLQRGDAELLIVRLEQRTQHCEIAVWLLFAKAGGMAQSGEHTQCGSFTKLAANQRIKQLSQFLAATGSADDFNPRARAVARHAFVAEQLAQHFAGERRLDGLECKLKLLRAARWLPCAGLHGGNPRLGEFVDREPERVVEERVHRFVEGSEREFCCAVGLDAPECANSFEADARMFVGDKTCEQFGGVGEGFNSIRQCPHRSSPDAAIFRAEQFGGERAASRI